MIENDYKGPASELTLYFGIKPGRQISVRSAALAALELEAMLKEAAFFVDPSVGLTLTLRDATEGSFRIRSLIRAHGSIGSARRAILTAVLTASTWLTLEIGSNIVEDIWETYTRDSQESLELTHEERDTIALLLEHIRSNRIGSEQAMRIFEFGEDDQNITSIGVTTRPDGTPPAPVPRPQFRDRIVQHKLKTEAEKTRTESKVTDVVLISPVLEHGNFRWKFQDQHHRFGAYIRDEKFVDDVLNGKFPIQMRAGIHMNVELETKSELIDGVWQTKEHNIVRVIGVSPVLRDVSLPLDKANDEH